MQHDIEKIVDEMNHMIEVTDDYGLWGLCAKNDIPNLLETLHHDKKILREALDSLRGFLVNKGYNELDPLVLGNAISVLKATEDK